MSLSYIPLKNHTAYSLSQGAVKISDYISIAQECEFPALGMCDLGNLFGALEFSKTLSDKGIQPVIGCMLQVSFAQKLKTFSDQITVFAHNEEGYRNLLKLVTKSYLEGQAQGEPRILYPWLEELSSGLILLSSSYKGTLGRHFLSKDSDSAKEFAVSMKEVFKDRFYIEISRHGINEEVLIEDSLLDLAYDLNIPIVATNEVFFKTRDDHAAQDALLCISQGARLSESNRSRLTSEHYFKTHDEMSHLFNDLKEGLENSIVIAQRCNYWSKTHKPMLPKFPLENDNEAEELEKQAFEGLRARLEHQVFSSSMSQNQKQEITKNYTSRLEFELDVIKKMGFPGYFLIVSDFIKWAKSKDIPVGPGRGSGAGSCVAWSLMITDIDPIRFNLIFERFLNPERVSMPDFDIDFCQDRRDEVIEYVKQRYGSDRVAQIITFGKFQAKMIVKDVGRVLEMPYFQVDRFSKLIPHNPANPVSLEDAISSEHLLQEAIEQDETTKKMVGFALKLEGLYRHASTHAAGIVIGDRPLVDVVALYHDQKSPLPAVQYSMKYAEMAGLMKFDFLGLKTLTILADVVKLISNTQNKSIDLLTIPLDDPATFALLNRLETIGIFQIESPGMKDVVKRMRPDRFEDIIALVALYRPGPMDDIPRYCACKHGDEDISIPHPLIEDILKPTYGVMVYQEQVMQIAQVMCGYTLGAADLLRRAMGKKIKTEMDEQRIRFVEGAVEKGVKRNIADQVFDQVAKFAGYGFNKSHAAPYALISYQTAYLKANFGVEFLACTMTHDQHNTDKLAVYSGELKRMDIKLLPPDINESYDTFTVENSSIRYSLAALKGVGRDSVNHIMEERTKNGKFKDIFDFAGRIDPKALNKKLMESLIQGGSFDGIHKNRAELFENIEILAGFNAQISKEKKSQQMNLFGDDASTLSIPNLKKSFGWSEKEKADREYKAIGFYLTSHPLEQYHYFLERRGIMNSYDLSLLKTSGQIRIVGVIHNLNIKISKTGKKYAFVTLSDSHGNFEIMIFSEILEKYKNILEPGRVVVLNVQVKVDFKEDTDEEIIRLMTESIDAFENFLIDQNNYIQIYLKEFNFENLRSLLKQEDGVKVYLKFIIPFESKYITVAPSSGVELSAKALMQLEKIPGIEVKWL